MGLRESVALISLDGLDRLDRLGLGGLKGLLYGDYLKLNSRRRKQRSVNRRSRKLAEQREAMSTAEGVNLRSRVNPRSGKQRSVNRRSRKLAEQHEAMSTGL